MQVLLVNVLIDTRMNSLQRLQGERKLVIRNENFSIFMHIVTTQNSIRASANKLWNLRRKTFCLQIPGRSNGIRRIHLKGYSGQKQRNKAPSSFKLPENAFRAGWSF